MSEYRIVTAKYDPSGVSVTDPIYKGNYGNILRLVDFPEGMIPETFEMHFSVGGGNAKTQIGTNNEVLILDECLTKVVPITAWLFLHDAATDGETKHEIRIPVKPKDNVTDAEPTPIEQSVITQAIAALNSGVERAEDAQEAAEEAQEGAEAAATRAEQAATSAQDAAQSAAEDAAAAVETELAEYTQAAESAATRAANSATDANSSREAADVSATNAGVSERNAAASATAAAGSASEAGQSATAASQKAEEAAGYAQSISGSAQAAQTAAQTATTKAGEASQSASTAAQKAQEAASSATSASQSATAANTAKTQAETAKNDAVTAKNAAQTAATNAAGSAQAAQDVLESIPADYDSMILVSDTQPASSTHNKIWIKTAAEEEYTIPTYEEFEQVSSAIDDLDDTVNDVIAATNIVTLFAEKIAGDATLPEGFSTGNGYLRNMNLSNPGNLAGTGSAANRWYSVQATADMDVFVEFVSGSSRQLGVFNNASSGSANRATPIFLTNDENYPMPTVDNPVHVEVGQYLTFSYYNGATTLDAPSFKVFTVVKGDAALIATTPLTDTMRTQVVEEIHSAMMSGYYHLPVANFARKAWDSNGTRIDNRLYRVRYINPITFDRSIFVIMSEGYTISGYADGVFFGSTTIKRFLPDVEYKIYVRRFTEDTSETADIAEFANALNLATALADLNLYKPTFTDVSMFERVGICGDSYAAGGGIISGVRPLTWGKNLERQAGITVDIYAKSGQNVMQWVADSTNGLPALLAGEECGLYWLQHGINGTSTDEQFGSLDDITTYPHPNTFCGQYTEAIEQIKTAFPKARIIMATIIGSSFGLYQSTYAKVNNAVRAIAQHCEVMVVDVADDDFYRSEWYSGWSRSNHPTAMQNSGIAMANRRLISKCIQDNPEYFVNYGVRS